LRRLKLDADKITAALTAAMPSIAATAAGRPEALPQKRKLNLRPLVRGRP
jgi:hypothetical protein